MMDQVLFWALVERTKKVGKDNWTFQAAALELLLLPYSVEDITTYERIYRALHWHSCMHRLYQALVEVIGPVSALEYEFFRHWLISRGAGVFDDVTSQPGRLCEFVVARRWTCEDYAWMSAAERAYEFKTGCCMAEMEELLSEEWQAYRLVGYPWLYRDMEE
jgi:hypothetical protein